VTFSRIGKHEGSKELSLPLQVSQPAMGALADLPIGQAPGGQVDYTYYGPLSPATTSIYTSTPSTQYQSSGQIDYGQSSGMGSSSGQTQYAQASGQDLMHGMCPQLISQPLAAGEIYTMKKDTLSLTSLNSPQIQLPREVITKAAALRVSNNQQITNIKKPRQPQQQVQAPVRVGTSDLVTNKNKTRTRGGAELH
jgi:hypothetical protein